METAILELAIMFVLGIIFGSFNSLLIHRLPTDGAIIFTRSACPTCHQTLRPRDLIPLLSWVFSLGKCRICATKISIRYPATELATGLLFLLCYYFHGITAQSIIIALLGSHLIVLCVIDVQHRIIPDILQIIIATLGIAYGIAANQHIGEMIGGCLIGGLIGLGLKVMIRALKKQEGLGMGDVKFMAASGIWLGVSLLSYYFYAGLIGILSAILWKLFSDDPKFPFGPALAISLFILVIYPPSEMWFFQVSVNIVTMLGII